LILLYEFNVNIITYTYSNSGVKNSFGKYMDKDGSDKLVFDSVGYYKISMILQFETNTDDVIRIENNISTDEILIHLYSSILYSQASYNAVIKVEDVATDKLELLLTNVTATNNKIYTAIIDVEKISEL